jgi:hypothetical protein
MENLSHISTVVMPTVLQLLVDEGASTPVQAQLQYDPTDPYAVSLVLTTPDGPNTWFFARELLVLGQVETAGVGDIQIWPGSGEHGDAVLIELTTDENEAILAASSSEVTAFLEATFRVVAAGAESDLCDIDAMIAGILDGAANRTEERASED